MKKRISNGVYIVVDPAMDSTKALHQLKEIRDENIAAIQIWDNPEQKDLELSFLKDIIHLFKDTKVPVLINNRWELVKEAAFDGVHFDVIPGNFQQISREIGNSFLKGLTLNNHLEIVKKAVELNFDYVSFCSLFPSETSNSCEIVTPESIMKCRAMTEMPIFLAGGINLDNIKSISHFPVQGVAVVSSIMKAENPKNVLQQYNSILQV